MSQTKLVIYFLRFALGVSFLSAVADRFGFWGAPGAANVVWGDFASFTAYTGVLNPFMPQSLWPALAWIATIVEVVLGLLLLIGVRTKEVALASGGLLFLFAFSMAIFLSPKAPLDYSVLSACAAACALYVLTRNR